MSRAKFDQAVYYIGDNTEKKSAELLRKNIAQRKSTTISKIPVVQFDDEIQEVPRELILLAHSNDSRTTIGDLSPQGLAQLIANHFEGKDKTELKSIKLVACEGGFGDNPLALQLVRELHRVGFTSVVVKAATHPKEGKIGGLVSVITQTSTASLDGNHDGEVQAVMYGNQLTADYLRWKQLERIHVTKENPGGRTSKQQTEMESLAIKHKYFHHFDKNDPRYCEITLVSDIDELDASYNSYTKNGVQASLSLDAAIALDELRKLRHTHSLIPDNKKILQFLDKVIAEINKNPSMNKDGFLQILQNPQFIKGVNSKVVADIAKFAEAMDAKREALDPDASFPKVSTIGSVLEDDEDYLERLLAKDGILVKFFRTLHGTEDFTKGLRLLVKGVISQTLSAKVERESIIQSIDEQKAKDNDKLTITEGFFSKKEKDTPLKALYAALNDYCTKPNPTTHDWALVQKAQNSYKENKGSKSTELESLIIKLGANNKKFNDIGTGLKEVKDTVNNAITAYLKKYDKDGVDDLHKSKVVVMKAMKDYVNRPTEDNWAKLEASTTNNPGWDKGLFSKVKFMMKEVRQAREEQKGLEEGGMSPK